MPGFCFPLPAPAKHAVTDELLQTPRFLWAQTKGGGGQKPYHAIQHLIVNAFQFLLNSPLIQPYTMSCFKIYLIFLFFICLISSKTNGAEYFVSNSGSDSAEGNFDDPFRTLKHVGSIMQPGDICFIREGVYRETITSVNSGTESQPIVFTAFQGENVLVTGLDLFEGWKSDHNKVWKSSCTTKVSDLFFDNVYGNCARYPNNTSTEFDSDNWANVELFSNKSGTMEGISSLGSLKGAKAIGLGQRRWVTVMGEILSNSGTSFTVTNTSSQWSNSSPEIYLGKGKGFLIDHRNLLDAPLEWFSDGENLYIIPPENTNPNEIKVEARTRLLGADLNNRKNIHLKGIHFKAASLNLRNAENCSVESCSFRYIIPFFTFKNGFNRDTSAPESWDGNGIEISGSNNRMKDCYIAHSWGDGVTMWGENNVLENCIIEDCDWLAVDSAPLCVTGSGHRITQNTLRKTARSVLVHRHLKAAEITYNDMGYCGLICDDLGLTYSFQTDGAGTEIAYNWVHDNLAAHTGPGIYLDNGDANYLIHHNVVWNCEAGIRLNLPQTNTFVYNNTFWNNKSPMGEWGPDGTKMTNCRMWNNIQDHEKFIGNSLENNLFTEVDQFIGANVGDFRLADNAQAIDYGRDIDEITDGFIGTAPDAGAYEYRTNWQAGANLEVEKFEDSKPNAASAVSVEVISSGVLINWFDQSNNESGFIIDRKIPDGPIEEIIRTAPNSSQAIDSLIEPYTTYFYRVRSFNKYGSNASFGWSKITTTGDGSMVFLQAEEYDEQVGINASGEVIGSCDHGDYIVFRDIDFGAGLNFFTMRCAVPSEFASNKVNIVLDDQMAAAHATTTVKATGDWNKFEEQTLKIDEIKGIHDLYFVFSGGYGVGNFDWFKFSNVSDTVSSKNIQIQSGWQLGQNFPNPFNHDTSIQFALPVDTRVNLIIRDLSGKHVRTIIDDHYEKGQHHVVFNANGLSPGVYFYQISADQFKNQRKMLLIH